MALSSDPSLVDTPTLKESYLRDLKESGYAIVRDDFVGATAWLMEAQVTMKELMRRAHLKVIK